MRIVEPIAITPDKLVSSSVPEDDFPTWNSTANYAVGAKVVYNHRCYEALVANTNVIPTDPTKWLDLGATNRWRMFDEKSGTKTTGNNIVVEIDASFASFVGLCETYATSVSVEMKVGGTTVYLATKQNYPRLAVADYWEYFFGDYELKKTYLFDGLPPFGSARIIVSINGNASVGALIVGKVYEFSDGVLYGARTSIQDYSRKERDEWGNFFIAERSFSNIASFEFIFDRNKYDMLQSLLSRIRARPALYIGGSREDATAIYGFFKNFDIIINHPFISVCSIEVESI